MAEIYLDPKEFQVQITEFETRAKDTGRIKFELDKQALQLESIEKYMECITLLNDTLVLYNQLMEKDVLMLKKIKATWMGADSDIATKTLGQILFGK